jgi:hypothetical protein
MNFQRIVIGLLALLIAGLAGSFYMNWKTLAQLRTVKAFVENYVFADAVAACEMTQSTTPLEWRQADSRDRIEFGQAQQGHHQRQLHLGGGQRVLRLRSDQEKG